MSSITIIISILAVLFFITVSAFFSASEASVLASSRVRLYHLAKKGNHRASILLTLQARMGSFISTILLANTWSNTLGTALAASVMTELFDTAGAVYAAVIMGGLITIYAEVMPKILIYTNPDRFAMAFAPIFKPLVWILTPVTVSIEWVAEKTLRIFGVHIDSKTQTTSSTEELRGAIELHSGSSHHETEQERAMLRSILDLSQVGIHEIMTHRKDMFMVDAGLPTDKILDAVMKSPYTRIPLWEGNPDNIIGILHTKNLLREARAQGGDLEKVHIQKIAQDPWFVPESTTLFEQLHSFRERKAHFALVVDEYGSLLGMLTLEDILEEIVGEIVDEHDVELPGVKAEKAGSYLIKGTVTLRDLNRQFRWDLDDTHAATIAGLILNEVRHIPAVGQIFMINGFRIEILRRHRHQITQVRLTPPLKMPLPSL